MNTGQNLYKAAKNMIPGGTQLLSKRPEMFAPDVWPAYYKKAKGCRVWDLDDNEYTDMSIMGIGANILGYADDDVDNAVIEAHQEGQKWLDGMNLRVDKQDTIEKLLEKKLDIAAKLK